MTFALASYFVWLAMTVFTFVRRFNHYPWISDPSKNCGPIPNLEAGQELIDEFLDQSQITSTLQKVLFGSWPNLIFMLICLIALIYK